MATPKVRCVGAVLLAAFAAAGVRARVVEEQLDVPVQVSDAYGKRVERPIKVTVWSDDALPGPKPVLVLNHGRDGEAAGRAALGRARYSEISGWFARNGFVVAVPTRIGYGVTGGDDVEDSGACEAKNFGPGFAAAATEILAALQAVRARPDAAPDRGVIVGQSYGGASTVAAAAADPPGVVAAINFAGGSGGNPKVSPRRPCGPHLLRRQYAKYGAAVRMPMLWIYTENDQYWGPDLPREWFDAFREAGAARAEFVRMPPHGDDGHQLFSRFVPAWQPAVADFLRQQGFEMKAAP